jgi:hypothetical protein
MQQSREQNPQFVRAVNALMRELAAHNVTSDYCARCSTNNWNVDVLRVYAEPMQLIGSGWSPPPASGAYFGAPGYIPTLCLVCNNCGNMIFHNLQTLTKRNPNLLQSLGFKE